MDFRPAIVPTQAEDLPRYLDDTLQEIGRALSTEEDQLSPLYLVRDEDSGNIIGGLTSSNDQLALIGAEFDDAGNIVGGRPVWVLGSSWNMNCPSWQVPGMQLPANLYGYDLQVANDGVTVIAIPNPQPAYQIIVTAVTDHDLSANDLVWTKVTADSAAISNSGTGIPVGSTLTYRVYLHDLSLRGGTVDVGVGLNGAVPLVSSKLETLAPGAEFLSSGVSEITTLIPDGDTFALWCMATNAHLQSDLWAEGSTVETYVKLETR